MPYVFHPEAEREYKEAAAYYDEQRSGLGNLFVQEVEDSINKIRERPDAWPLIGKKARRIRTRIFQYGIVYEFKNSTVTIYAIMHLHRKPGYWAKRQR